jgi:hypothetical protein
MTRTLCSASLVFVTVLSACSAKKDPDVRCSSSAALEHLKKDARAASELEYSPPAIEPCPELDPPLDGQSSAPGLTPAEYNALLRGANGNFFDDGVWWIKATPRGGTHVVPMTITAERCEEVTFDKFGYDYAFATPALSAAPACGRYLTGIFAGHQLGDGWPQIFSIESSGLIRLAPLANAVALGAYLRMPRDLLATPTGDSSVDHVDIALHDAESIELAALVNGPSFSSAVRLVFKSGDPSRLGVTIELNSRAPGADLSRIAIAGLSGSFLPDGTRDGDRVEATYSDGTSEETALADPNLNWGTGDWTTVSRSPEGVELASAAFQQNASGTAGVTRTNVTLSNIDSNVPVGFELAFTSEPTLGGNVAANLVLDLSGASALDVPVRLSYLVTASRP